MRGGGGCARSSSEGWLVMNEAIMKVMIDFQCHGMDFIPDFVASSQPDTRSARHLKGLIVFVSPSVVLFSLDHTGTDHCS